MNANLRAIERRVLAMRANGLGAEEIAARLRRSPEHVERMIAWSEYPRSGTGTSKSTRAIQERVLALRSSGESHDRIADRFRKSPRFIRQVEGLAHYRKAMELLS
ncbi:MAG: hypothetical protein H0V96_05405 [Acidimicrobiia bacterium]|nr:hypothetical protein [Acidimicrobiia bacterium]